MAELTSVLDQAGVEYELLSHAHTERAVDEAEALGLPPRAVAKTLVLTAGEGHFRVVLPASERIDLRKVRDHVEGGKSIHLATEGELAGDTPSSSSGRSRPLAAPATAFSSTRGSRSNRRSCRGGRARGVGPLGDS